MTADLKAHAGRLRELHHAGEMLVLPNVRDAASATIVGPPRQVWRPLRL
jgi:2-methylisocitrate lyase-like PEP mutase family enzyme